MSDVPVPESRLEELYRGAVSMQAMQAIYWRRSARKSGWLTSGLAIAVAALAILVLALLPLKEYVPTFIYTNEAGLNETTTAISSLPPSAKVAGVEAALWRYLRDREHYAPSEADESYAIVSAMSSTDVRNQYQRWANPKLNKEAPAVKLGNKGYIRIYRRGSSFNSHSDDFSSGVYQILFCRVVSIDTATMAQAMKATIAYRLAESLPLVQRITANPVGVIVTEYPGMEADEPAPRYIQPGSDNPCGH